LEREDSPKLYIRLRKNIRVMQGTPIVLEQVAQLIAEPGMEQKLKRLVLIHPQDIDGNYIVIDMLMIVKAVKSVFPRLSIEHFGDPQTLVEMVTPKKQPHPAVIAFVWLLLFVGSGLAIMNFHTDVSMMKVHQKIYEFVTGEYQEHPYLLQIPYSVGLGAGMIMFFNRLFRKKFSEEPNPLEVEMYLYQENLQQYVIHEEYQKKLEKSDGT
jgi:stage V sporulation protein AA